MSALSYHIIPSSPSRYLDGPHRMERIGTKTLTPPTMRNQTVDDISSLLILQYHPYHSYHRDGRVFKPFNISASTRWTMKSHRLHPLLRRAASVSRGTLPTSQNQPIKTEHLAKERCACTSHEAIGQNEGLCCRNNRMRTAATMPALDQVPLPLPPGWSRTGRRVARVARRMERSQAASGTEQTAGCMRSAIRTDVRHVLGPDYGEINDAGGWNGDAFSGPVGDPRSENVACFALTEQHGYEPGGDEAVIKHVHWCPSSFAIDDIGSSLVLVVVINAMTATVSTVRVQIQLCWTVSTLPCAGIVGTQATELFGDGVASQARQFLVCSHWKKSMPATK